jgi:excisionase family DNA binding protein
MENIHKKVLSFDEGVSYLGYAKSTVYKLTSSGILPFSKPHGKKIFFEREKLEAWMLSNAKTSHDEKRVEAATYVSTRSELHSKPKKG